MKIKMKRKKCKNCSQTKDESRYNTEIQINMNRLHVHVNKPKQRWISVGWICFTCENVILDSEMRVKEQISNMLTVTTT